MINLAILKVRGLSNAVCIVDILLKHLYIDFIRTDPDMAQGNMNILVKGELGSLYEINETLNTYLKCDISYSVSVLPRFEYKIIHSLSF